MLGEKRAFFIDNKKIVVDSWGFVRDGVLAVT